MIRRGFTLIEVNLAMLIMAGGILSIVGLYALGFRESRQSAEDVQSAAYADAVLSPLVMAITATNVPWSAFRSEFKQPSAEGWGAYIKESTGAGIENPNGHAQAAYSATIGQFKGAQNNLNSSFPITSSKVYYGLVVQHEADSAVVQIGFRASKTAKALMSAPLYYTEARFQGDPDK